MKKGPTKREPKTKKGWETRSKILGAAAACIAEIGTDKTTVTQIAKRAAVPRSLVARYIPKKADLLINVIEFWDKQRIIKETPDLPPFEREVEALQDMTQYLEWNPHFATAVLLVYYYSRIDPRMARYCREFSKFAEESRPSA